MKSIAHRAREWAGELRRHAELDRLEEAELGRIASDTGLSASELYALSRTGPDSAALLGRRLAALHLSEAVHARPAVLRDLERLCSLCQSKGQCQRDLDHDPSNPIWQVYCPNVATLQSLQ